MKKITNYLFLLILFMFIGTLNVEAGRFLDEIENEGSHFKCESGGNCKVLCSYIQPWGDWYEMRGSTDIPKTKDECLACEFNEIYIYYLYESDSYAISFSAKNGFADINTNSVVSSDMSFNYNKNTNTANDISFNSNKVFYKPGVFENLIENGVCPDFAYSEHNMYSEVCFDDDGTYCDQESSNFMTEFENNSTSNFNQFNFDIEKELESYFDSVANSVPGIDITEVDFDNLSSSEKAVMDDLCSHPEKVSEDTLTASFDNFKSEILNIKEGGVGNIETDVSIDFLRNWPSFKVNYDAIVNFSNNYEKYCEEKFAEDIENAQKLADEEAKQRELERIEAEQQALEEKIEQIENKVEALLEKLAGTWKPTNKVGTCVQFIGSASDSANKPPAYYIDMVFDIIKILSIIIVIVLSMIDFTNAITSDKELKGVYKKVILRLVILIVLLLLPTLIGLFGDLFGVPDILCGIG